MYPPKLSNDDPDDFNKWWNWAKSSLSDILDFGHNNRKSKFPLEKMISMSKSDYESGNKNGPITLSHIREFIMDMEFLRIYEPVLFKSFSKKFSSGPGKQFEYLTGLWFEVKIACLFLHKGFKFRCPIPDPPDFEITIDNQIISIECFSPRPEFGGSLYPKLFRTIESRKVKNYRKQEWVKNGPSVLFLEGNWILHSMGEETLGTNYSLPKEICDTLSEIEKNSFYDLVVLLIFGRLTDSGQNASTISCVYAPAKISDSYLTVFIGKLLDEFKEEHEIKILLPNLPMESGSN